MLENENVETIAVTDYENAINCVIGVNCDIY